MAADDVETASDLPFHAVLAGDDRVASLRAIRDELAKHMEGCEPREAASLARQLVIVIAEIDELREARSDGIDELRARRVARLADAASAMEPAKG